jgi:hypothetical protein
MKSEEQIKQLLNEVQNELEVAIKNDNGMRISYYEGMIKAYKIILGE